jgi:hypothetical protein
MAERLNVASIDEVAERKIRTSVLEEWLDGGVWKLRPEVDYSVHTEVMQRRLYGVGVRRRASVAARQGSDEAGAFLLVQMRPRKKEFEGTQGRVSQGRV